MKRNKSLEKAYEITDAKISFVSLVDKAANLRNFLITKSADGEANFTTYGRIVKKDAEKHYVTGIVYEPMTEDYDGNYMTEAEIEKACHWFAKNGDKVDLQHSFQPLAKAKVVENWIAKSDSEIGGQEVKKGTWLMTVEIDDEEIWKSIESGELTGFSMGGRGAFSDEDVDLDQVKKSGSPETPEATEKKGILKRLADLFGYEVVEKGQLKDKYVSQSKSTLFWNAFYALQEVVTHYDYSTGNCVFEDDESKIREALTEFNQIATELLTSDTAVLKSVITERPVEKSGRSLSGKNKATLQGIYDNLGSFLSSFEDQVEQEEKPAETEKGDEAEAEKGKPEENPDEDEDVKKSGSDDIKKEETEMTKQEIESAVESAVVKAIAKLAEKETEKPVEKSEENKDDEAVTPDTINKMVDEAVKKAMEPKEETLTKDEVQEMISKAVATAISEFSKSKGLPSNLNDEPGDDIEKSGQHYLHGIL